MFLYGVDFFMSYDGVEFFCGKSVWMIKYSVEKGKWGYGLGSLYIMEGSFYRNVTDFF